MGTFPEHAPERATSLAERLTEELARRSRRRSLEQKSHAGRISDDLVAMGGEAVPALIGRLDSLGEIGCTTLARIGPTAFSALVEALRAGPGAPPLPGGTGAGAHAAPPPPPDRSAALRSTATRSSARPPGTPLTGWRGPG